MWVKDISGGELIFILMERLVIYQATASFNDHLTISFVSSVVNPIAIAVSVRLLIPIVYMHSE